MFFWIKAWRYFHIFFYDKLLLVLKKRVTNKQLNCTSEVVGDRCCQLKTHLITSLPSQPQCVYNYTLAIYYNSNVQGKYLLSVGSLVKLKSRDCGVVCFKNLHLSFYFWWIYIGFKIYKSVLICEDCNGKQNM